MKKIDKMEVFVGCGHGQHSQSDMFKLGCNACIAATIARLVDVLNRELDTAPAPTPPPADPPKPPKKDK